MIFSHTTLSSLQYHVVCSKCSSEISLFCVNLYSSEITFLELIYYAGYLVSQYVTTTVQPQLSKQLSQ